jgi:hypothetical protein
MVLPGIELKFIERRARHYTDSAIQVSYSKFEILTGNKHIKIMGY